MNIRKTSLSGSFATGFLLTCCLLFPPGISASDSPNDGGQEDAATGDYGYVKKHMKRLEQRVQDLESSQIAQEDATRAIIRDTLSTLGSKINEFVTLGGTLEVLAGWEEDFFRQSTSQVDLATAQLDFEVQVNDWTLGSFILEFLDGRDNTFTTTDEREVGVARVNVDTAVIVIGDPQRFPPVLTLGRMIVPFGISTGNPVTDVLTLAAPMTLDAFETRRNGIRLGVGFPTPPLKPAAPPVIPPPVKPLVLNPFLTNLKERLGFPPPPTRPPPPTPLIATPDPPPFNVSFYVFDGLTHNGMTQGVSAFDHFGGTAGYRTRGNCGNSYDDWGTDKQKSWLDFFCPWTFDIDVDYNNSIFDSLFLALEYEKFLADIGFVGAMATHVKSTLGPVGMVAEYNWTVDSASFMDDSGTFRTLRPSAWQVAFSYQFDWNPWVVEMGAQGTYLALLYSESQDLAGVSRMFGGALNRVGNLPRTRFAVDAGEWIMDNVRLTLEYAHANDYPVHEGGTGKSSNGVFSQLTMVW